MTWRAAFETTDGRFYCIRRPSVEKAIVDTGDVLRNYGTEAKVWLEEEDETTTDDIKHPVRLRTSENPLGL